MYMNDLAKPDIHHGRDTPKVKNLAKWKAIQTICPDVPYNYLSTLKTNKVYFWSDQHFGHKNIIPFCNRPFTDTDEMASIMIDNHNNIVKPNDTVFWVGDIGFMSVPKINEVLDQLNGYKIHIVGNHDIERNGNVYKLNVDEQYPCYSLVTERVNLLLTHYPLDTLPNKCINVHGHIHTNVITDKKHINVCVEHTNYTPRSLESVLEQSFEYLDIK